VERNITQGEQNLLLLEEMIPSGERLYIWCYSRDGELVATSCPVEVRREMADLFAFFGGHEQLKRYGLETDNTRPEIIGSPIGLQWALSYESERNRELIFVAGPVFYVPTSAQQIRDAMRTYPHSSENVAMFTTLIGLVPEIPVTGYAVFIRYVVMIHNILTGQQLGLEVFEASGAPLEAPGSSHARAASAAPRDRTRVYLAEQALLRMVRDGDINYSRAFQNSMSQSPGVPVKGRDPLRQQKTSIIVFTTLVSRAAMEGGLSPEVAYPLGDSYIQSVEECRDSGELSALAMTMYHDFIYRVHHVRSNPGYSPAIQKCCDYIELSLDRRIRTADLAALVGYTENYLTEKFKKETGQSVSSYIRKAKVDRAKLLLETSDLSVTEIADRLAFNTVNYFIQSFRETTGFTPAGYRKQFRKLN